MKYDKQGREMPDDTPVEVPLRFRGQHASSGDVLQGMLARLREEQEKEVAETSQEFEGAEPPEMFDLPTRYELDHDVEERALLFAENAERMRLQRRAAEKESHEDRDHGSGKEGGAGGAGRVHQRARKAGRKAERAADRERGAAEESDGSEDDQG